jgi:hypothetical protein
MELRFHSYRWRSRVGYRGRTQLSPVRNYSFHRLGPPVTNSSHPLHSFLLRLEYFSSTGSFFPHLASGPVLRLWYPLHSCTISSWSNWSLWTFVSVVCKTCVKWTNSDRKCRIWGSWSCKNKVKLSRNRPWRPIGLWDVKDPTLSRQSVHRWR